MPAEVPPPSAGLPPGLPPGFPPIDGLPPGLPPGFPPGFVPPEEPVLGPAGPPGTGPPQGPGRPPMDAPPDMIGPPPSEPPPSRMLEPAFVPPPSEPPPARLLELSTLGVPLQDASERKRRRGVEGLAPNKNIKMSSGSVTIYNGYDAVTTAKLAGPAPKAAAAAPATAPAKTSSSSFSAVQGQEALPRQLPEGWEMKKSRTTGKVYYVNEKLGKSQFEPPAGSSIKATSQKKQKQTLRPKDVPDAQQGDRNGVVGVVRATDHKKARWQKWQNCSRIVNQESPERTDT